MGQKDSRPSYNSAYDYGNSSVGYNSRYSANTPSGYSPRYAPSVSNNVQQPEAQARLQRKYSRIGDDYRSVGQVCVIGLLCLSLALLLSFPTFDAWFSTWCSWAYHSSCSVIWWILEYKLSLIRFSFIYKYFNKDSAFSILVEKPSSAKEVISCST